MPRPRREIKEGYCYHVTTRCNNREFRLTSTECRKVFLYAIKKALDKFGFKLYALCIMSNHVHYLIEPAQPEDLPKIMHWLNWYTAMCFNRMLNRTGHFWEKRYYSAGFDKKDHRRALNTLRYIHANPKSAGRSSGLDLLQKSKDDPPSPPYQGGNKSFHPASPLDKGGVRGVNSIYTRSLLFYDFSNYGTYDRLTDDGLTQWHPQFLALGQTLEECARKYREFCRRYKPQPKKEKHCHWGSKLLPKVIKPKGKKSSPGQMHLPWASWNPIDPEIVAVAKQFVMVNCYNPTFSATGENLLTKSPLF